MSAFVINATSGRLSPSRLLAVTQLNKCAVTPAPHLPRTASFKLEKPATRKMTAAEPSGLFCKSEMPQERCILICYLIIYSFKVYFRTLQIGPIFSTNSVLTSHLTLPIGAGDNFRKHVSSCCVPQCLTTLLQTPVQSKVNTCRPQRKAFSSIFCSFYVKMSCSSNKSAATKLFSSSKARSRFLYFLVIFLEGF